MKNRPRSPVWIALPVVLCLALLTACGQPAARDAKPAAAPPASQPTAQTPPQAVKPVELRLGHFLPPTHSLHANMMAPWAKEIEQKSGGRIRINIFPGGVLGKPQEYYEAAVQVVMDIAFGLQAYTAGKFPLTSVVELPFLYESAPHSTKALWRLYQEMPALQNEYRDVKVLALWTHDVDHIMTAKKQIKALEDLKGLRIRAPGAAQNR